MTATYYVGTQGWSYPAWAGPFYPAGTPASGYLEVYTRAFTTVEVDSSFYAVPPASHFLGWAERAPAGFRFSLKLPAELTHERRLRDGVEVLTTFCRRAELLGDRLGVILVQLPPDFTPRERSALRAFLGRLPRHLRFAVEFRHPGWLDDATLELLNERGIAHAVSDGPWIERERTLEAALRPTTDVAYFRWMGDRPHLNGYAHTQVDRTPEITRWAEVLSDVGGHVSEIYGYFNNHYEGHSPASARRLLKRLGQPVVEPAELNPQLPLF